MTHQITSAPDCRRPYTAATIALATAGALACGVTAPAQAAPGWQKPFTFDVPTGRTSQFIHYPCPGSLVADSGGFAFNSVGQADDVYLGFNGPRVDESPANFHEWGWHFFWPAGAKAGETVIVDVHCKAN